MNIITPTNEDNEDDSLQDLLWKALAHLYMIGETDEPNRLCVAAAVVRILEAYHMVCGEDPETVTTEILKQLDEEPS